MNSVRNPLKLSFVLLAVVVLLIFLHYFNIISPVENLFIRIFSPVQNVVYSLGIKINGFYNPSDVKGDLTELNSELEQKVFDLTIENSQLKTLLFEKQELNQQLDFVATAGFEAVIAKVIGKNSQSEYQTLILNKGSRDGVKIGLSVIAGNGVIIGKVVEVGESSCQVLSINDNQSSLAATIQNQAMTKGVVSGDKGLSLKMDLIPQNEEIANGDVVVTSGLEPNIPRGLVIGTVEQVVNEPNDFFQQAFLRSAINSDDLVIVSILKNIYND